MAREYRYELALVWTGNLGAGTTDAAGYSRDLEISGPGKPTMPGSADPHFRGDASRYNPEELLIAGISACHMLWYLRLCADAGIKVTAYRDSPTGTLDPVAPGGGRMTEVVLRPVVEISAGDPEVARSLHATAHARCYVSNSVNFPVRWTAEILDRQDGQEVPKSWDETSR